MPDQIFELYEICYHCHGSGTIPVYSGGTGAGTDTCFVCGGSGKITSQAIEIELSYDIDALGAQLDAIIAEQASLRADLTEVLTRIWNKVKDL